MNSLFRLVCVAAALVITCSHASTAKKNMPTDFVGEWCREKGGTNNEAWYTLPSWTDGNCTDVLSIDRYGFRFGNKHCEPEKIQLRKGTAPSGESYTARVTARCSPDGPPTTGQLRTFQFYRYKGRLTLASK